MKRILLCTALWIGMIVFPPGSAAAGPEGFFSLDKQEGRWWLIDPEGERFFSAGVCSTRADGFFAPDLGYSPYYENIMEIYGSEEAWGDEVVDRLSQWNVNTLGAWSDVELLGDRIPYTINLGLSGHNWEQGTIPDFFDQDFFDRVADQVANRVIPHVEDANLIGYFFDNEMRWGVDHRKLQDLAADYFELPPDAPGKIRLKQFLEDRYNGNVDAFNSAWGMNIENFNDLLTLARISHFPQGPAQEKDRADFTYLAAEQYFSTCHDQIRAVDANHLLLGARFIGWLTPQVVTEAIAPYTDVVSINYYAPWWFYELPLILVAALLEWTDPGDTFALYHETTGRPILVSEFNMRAMDSGLPNSKPPNWVFKVVETQEQRADFFEDFARDCFASGHVVGYHWYAYMDEPPEGRPDGEDSNVGLVDNHDVPWEPLVQRMSEVNPDAYVWPIPDDDDDDDSDDDISGEDDSGGDDDGCGC